METFCDEESTDQETLRWPWLESVIAADLWEDECWHLVATRQVARTRQVGALSELPAALDSLATAHVISGEFATAAFLYDEVTAVCEAIGSEAARVGPIVLGAWRGDERGTRPLIEAMISEAESRGQGAAVTVAHAFEAVLCNGLGKYEDRRSARPKRRPGTSSILPRGSGAWQSSSKPQHVAASPRLLATLLSAFRRAHKPAEQTGHWAWKPLARTFDRGRCRRAAIP